MKNCKYNKQCGGCNYLDVDYAKQLEYKKKDCISLLQKENLKGVEVVDTMGAVNPYYYRNKVIVAFNQNYEYGLYQEGSHDIISYDTCLLHDDVIDPVLKTIQQLFKKYRVSIYDEKRNRGLIRHVLVRRGVKSNQTMVVLVCNESVFNGSKNFCKLLIQKHPSIKTIVMNVNKRKTSVVLGEEEKILYGSGFIIDTLCDLKFKISAKSFYQINHSQCEVLYSKATSLLQFNGDEVVLDTYCGIGTIGMTVAKSVSKVIGVELNKDAIKDAKQNAAFNSISNIQFICDDATKYMVDLANQNKSIDVVIMDPPRSGSTKQFIDAIFKLKVPQVLYISCDPQTQVRDLVYFKKMGYTFDTLIPVDMFPNTKHIESIVCLKKK